MNTGVEGEFPLDEYVSIAAHRPNGMLGNRPWLFSQE